jgi:ribonucleoside-diphosphate reductase alpha chain
VNPALEMSKRVGHLWIFLATPLLAMDYFSRWLDLKFLSGDQGDLFDALPTPTLPTTDGKGTDPVEALGELAHMGGAPACNICGLLMVRSGTCYRCMTRGDTSGCS